MSLIAPIVEGAYYERNDCYIVGPAKPFDDAGWPWLIAGVVYDTRGNPVRTDWIKFRLTRRVRLGPADPTEVVAELRRRSSECAPPGEVYGEEANFQSGRSDAFDASAAAVESMLGLAHCGEGCAGDCELTTSGPTKAETELAELRAKAVEVIAELKAEVADLARHNWNEYIRDRSVALTDAAKLVATKLGVKL